MSDEAERILKVERLGGLAGFGGAKSHLRSQGQVNLAALSAADQKTVEALFQSRGADTAPMPDAFRYKISRTTSSGTEAIEVPEHLLPSVITQSVKDELK